MYCTITVGLLLSNVSVASLPCSNFDQIAVVEERNQIAMVEERKVQLASLDHSYVPLSPSQPKKSENQNRDYNYKSGAIKHKKYVPVSSSYS